MATTSMTDIGADPYGMGHKAASNAGIDDTGSGGMRNSVRLGACIDMFRIGYSQVLQLKVGQPGGFRGACLRRTYPYEGLSPQLPQGIRQRQGHCSVTSEESR